MALHPETVKIEAGDSFAIINADDFDASQHKKYVEKKQRAKAAKKA